MPDIMSAVDGVAVWDGGLPPDRDSLTSTTS